MTATNLFSVLCTRALNGLPDFAEYILEHPKKICAKYWAQEGKRVLFISKTPLKHLPLPIGKSDSSLHPDVIKLIQFMYLPDWQALLQQLYSIHLRNYPVSVIIVKNLENYFENDSQDNEDHVSLMCSSLFHAASACAKVTSRPAFLISDYVSENSSIEKIVVKNFFHNVWELRTIKDENDRTLFNLSKLSEAANEDVVDYVFYENLEESVVCFDQIIKKISVD